MSKHNMFRTELPPKPSKLPIHPIWRGIGCIMISVIPLASYLISSMLIDSREKYAWLIVPEDLIMNKYPKDPLIVVRVLYALIILLVFIALMSLIISLIMKIFAPSKYDPMDVPPENIFKP